MIYLVSVGGISVSRKQYMWLAMGCIAIGLLSYLVTLNLLNDTTTLESTKNEIVQEKVIPEQEELIEEKAASLTTVSQIQPYTKMVYEYYYPKDGITKEQEDTPPYFLLDLTMEDVQKMYEDWQIITFSDKKVVMRKTMEGKSDERYVVGEKDGYVAVFYEEPKNGVRLHQITHTPVSSLPKEDQERLKNGISVLGDSNLSKILEDYES